MRSQVTSMSPEQCDWTGAQEACWTAELCHPLLYQGCLSCKLPMWLPAALSRSEMEAGGDFVFTFYLILFKRKCLGRRPEHLVPLGNIFHFSLK